MAKKKSKFRQKLVHDYRLVIMNHSNLEVKISFKLNRLQVFVIGGISILLLIVMTSLLIAFTPLKQYIPGYSSSKLRKQSVRLVAQVDSLEYKLKVNDLYLKGIQNLLNGHIKARDIDNVETIQSVIKNEHLALDASHNDSIFRREVEEKDRFTVLKQATKNNEIVFFSPVKGDITSHFNSKNKHFAVDIAVKKNTPIKAVAEGIVVFSGFVAETGYVLIIEHPQDFISVYKHNKSLFKEQGDLVLSGEVIANSGSTGNLTTGPHLHFELWSAGYPVNPLDFIDFK